MAHPPEWVVPFHFVVPNLRVEGRQAGPPTSPPSDQARKGGTVLVRAQPDVDVADDVPRRVVPCPTTMAPAVTSLSGLRDRPHGDALSGGSGEHADHLVVPAAGPDHTVGAI